MGSHSQFFCTVPLSGFANIQTTVTSYSVTGTSSLHRRWVSTRHNVFLGDGCITSKLEMMIIGMSSGGELRIATSAPLLLLEAISVKFTQNRNASHDHLVLFF